MTKLRFAAPLALVFLFAAPALADFGGYLFDALQPRAPFRPAWNKLIKDLQPIPDWLRQFNQNFDGASGQLISVAIDGKPYYESFVCKPTNCAERKFIVLFTADAAKAFGALGGHGETPEFFGGPSKAEQEEMAKGF